MEESLKPSLPLFSVLIANYNNGEFLRDAVDSVFKQTYPHWEIIIVDDASTDNSKEFYSKFAEDSRIHCYFNEENRGCGYTKRRCAELSHGEILGFLDPDDYLAPNALDVMVKAHLNTPSASLVYSLYYNLKTDSVSTHQRAIPSDSSFLQLGGRSAAISHFATFKKVFYDKTGGIDHHYKRAVDHDLYFRLEEVGEVLFVPEVLYYYRNNTGKNISTGDNSLRAFVWNFIGEADAFRRRGLEDTMEEPLYNHLKAVLDEYGYQTEVRIRNTASYRLGNMLLKPFRSIKKLFGK